MSSKYKAKSHSLQVNALNFNMWRWLIQGKKLLNVFFYYLSTLWAEPSLQCLSVSSTSALPTTRMFQNNRQKLVCQKYLCPAWWVRKINSKTLFLNSEPRLVKDKVRRGWERQMQSTRVRNGDRRGRERGYESFISLILLTTPQLGFIFSLRRWDTQRPVRTAALTWEGEKMNLLPLSVSGCHLVRTGNCLLIATVVIKKKTQNVSGKYRSLFCWVMNTLWGLLLLTVS